MQETLQELVFEVESYFNSMSYHERTIKRYQNGWNEIRLFMEENLIKNFESSVGAKFIEKVLGSKSYSELCRKEKDLIRCANVLTEYQLTGCIRFRSISKSYQFNGEIGELVISYLSSRKLQGITDDTTYSTKIYLHRFLDFLNANQVESLPALGKQHILGFINSLGFCTKSTIHCTLSSLRGFLKYLFDTQYLQVNLSYLVPKSSYKKETRLPTTYTKNEISRLINSVDNSSPKGKRDIAMIFLAARLGLRASDICGLKFENINWETNTIQLIQKKTKEKIDLPLLVEIGNAIIDYLKYGRPVSNLPYIFLRAGQPYKKLEEPTLHSIVSFYLRQAEIDNLDKRKHGPHALRHSLAGILLEKKTPLPVISEVLGHSNTESTKSYLRIDLDSLRQCALEVSSLKSPLYQEAN